MFVRMLKENSEHKKIIKYVTEEISDKLIKKGKAEILKGSELERYSNELDEVEAELDKDPVHKEAKAKAEEGREKAKVTSKKAIANVMLGDKISQLKKEGK